MNAILCYKQSLEKLSSSRNNGFQIQALGSLPARHVRPHSCYGRRKLEGAGIKNETRILCQADGSINRVFRTITDPCWPSNCSCLFGILSCSMIRSLTGKYQKGVVDKSREEIGWEDGLESECKLFVRFEQCVFFYNFLGNCWILSCRETRESWHTATVDMGRKTIVSKAIDRICELSFFISSERPVFACASFVLSLDSFRLVWLSWSEKKLQT